MNTTEVIETAEPRFWQSMKKDSSIGETESCEAGAQVCSFPLGFRGFHLWVVGDVENESGMLAAHDCRIVCRFTNDCSTNVDARLSI